MSSKYLEKLNYYPLKHYDLTPFIDGHYEDIVYAKKDDYNEVYIHFNLDNLTYTISYLRFIDNEEGMLVPMEQRETDWLKHCAKYGHWQEEASLFKIDLQLHEAIGQKLYELKNIVERNKKNVN